MRQAAIVMLCSVLITGCISTHRSNTAWFEEKINVGVLEAPPVTLPQGEEFMDSAVGIAAGLAVKAAAAVVKWEGSKYVKDSSGELKEADLGNLTYLAGTDGWVLSNHGSGVGVPAAYLTVLRYVTPKCDLGFWESLWRTLLWFERPTKLEPINAAFVNDLVTRVREANSSLMRRRDESTIKKAFGLDTLPENSFVGLVAILQITPTNPMVGVSDGYPNYRVELLDYRYSSLKAKNLSWIRVPFTDWEMTKSVIEVAIRGPKADMRLIGNQYEGKADFKLEWDREISNDNKPSVWKNKDATAIGKPLAKSPPVHTYDFRNFGIAVKLSEAGTLKEAFEKASEKITDIDVEALLKK